MEWQTIRWLEPSRCTVAHTQGPSCCTYPDPQTPACVQVDTRVICAMTIVPFAAITRPFWDNDNAARWRFEIRMHGGK